MQIVIVSVCLVFVHFVPVLTKSKHAAPKNSISNEELIKVSQELFEEDQHNLLSHVKISYQGFLNTSNVNDDQAELPLLLVSETVDSYDIIRKMKLLYNNFEANSSIDEIVSDEEFEEENEFIDSLLQTPVMKIAMNFLERKNIVKKEFNPKDLMKQLWFDFYPRNKNVTRTSSGFEHVFLSEVKKGKIIGLHNWIYFAEAEKRGDLNYKGWMRIIDLGKKAKIAKVRFSLKGLNKAVSSLFIGTSPELELALYTICFMARPDKFCKMSYDRTPFTITTHSLHHDSKRFVGSAYVFL